MLHPHEVVHVLPAFGHEQAVDQALAPLAGQDGVNIAAHQRPAQEQGVGSEIARPPLLASQGADRVSLETLPLDQVVIEDAPVSHHHLGESVREGDPVPERDVVLHDRRLAVLARHDQRPRMRRHGLGARGGDIQDVNRLLHDRPARNLNEGPVFHQRGVEGRKHILLEVGVSRKMSLQRTRSAVMACARLCTRTPFGRPASAESAGSYRPFTSTTRGAVSPRTRTARGRRHPPGGPSRRPGGMPSGRWGSGR